jgi:hypothetical protein
MANINPFPESDQKSHLRRIHLKYLVDYKQALGRDLAYFGLPSAEMLDIKLWRQVLGHITAVERDSDVAMIMYRTAQRLGVRRKTVIIEGDLVDTARLLAMEDDVAKLSLAELPLSEQDKIHRVRNIGHDVINLDLCGGFLYAKKLGESENARLLRYLIEFQAKHKNPFVLIITFNLRDTGKDDYDSFIAEALNHLDSLGIDTSEVRDFYTASEIKGQPPNLRRLRFCVPTYLHKIAFEDFQARSFGAWYYKTFYHTRLLFEPRQGGGALGLTWPPVDEFKELLRAPLKRLEVDANGAIVLADLPAPSLP